MADLTPRMTAQAWRALAVREPCWASDRPGSKASGGPPRRAKYRNKRITAADGEKYDSEKEYRHHQSLMLARSAAADCDRVVEIRRQQSYLLVEACEDERAVRYFADFVVTFADGRVEVQDTKSPPTRALRAYVIKRKLMRAVHGIRIIEL